MNRQVRIADGSIIDAAQVEQLDIETSGAGDGTHTIVAYMHSGNRRILEKLPPAEPYGDSLQRWAHILRSR